MTDTSAAFPTLGFDPLPGDPEVAKALRDDAAEFGRRMTQEACRLQKLAHRDGWQGLAADVFAQHLETLPRDLQRCGDAFSDLAVELTKYHTAFEAAKCEAKALEERAAAAKQTVQQAEFTYSAPVIQAPGDCPPVRDRGPLNDAEDSYGAILREAHGFAEKFNERCEVQAMATAIRNCTRFAPDEPGWSIVRRWAGTVFRSTPIGEAIGGIHDLINEHAEFFSDLANVLSDISGTLGILSLPLMFFPPLGTTAAVLALGAAAGSTTLKTSLFVGNARDANGNLYVNGGNLIRSYVDLGMNAAGVAGGAAAKRAYKLADNKATTFGKELAGSFSAEKFTQPLKPFSKAAQTLRKKGRAEGVGFIIGDTLRTFKTSYPGHLYNPGGVALTTFGPLATATGPDNYVGWRSPYSFRTDVPNLVTDASDQPDLGVRVRPVIAAADAPPPPPTIRQATPPTEPVMRD